MLSLGQVELRRGDKLLFRDATLQAHAGQKLGVVGANGCGKSSLFALILGELETDAGDITLPAHARIAHVAQTTPSGNQSALDFVQDGDEELRSIQRAIAQAEGHGEEPELYARLEAIDGFAAESRAARLLHGLGFGPGEISRPVASFSGGWRMRLNLARALMCRSDILLLDEPTNHLDLPAILWLERWLQRYPGILLVISHDRDFLDGVCRRIAHIEQQQLRCYNGNYSDFEALRSEQLAQQQSLFKRQQKEIRHMQSYVDRFRYKASKARQAQSRLKMLERMTRIAPAHVDSPFHFCFDNPERQPHHLVQMKSVCAGYDGSPVLADVDILISAGDRLGLLGVNGAGKSTLVKSIADGSTRLSGTRRLSKDTRIGYFAQHQLEQLDPALSAADHLLAVEPDLRESELRRYLGGFGFGGERIFEPVAPFSGGEKARLVLALMIRSRPNLLLLDEPTNHLDLEMRQALSRALVDFEGAIVVISHDRHLLRSVCDELWVVHEGRLDRFPHSVDEYGDWLRDREQAASAAGASGQVGAKPDVNNRRAQRKRDAELRLRLQPLSNRVRRVERDMEAVRGSLHKLNERLAEPELYGDSSRQQELAELMREQAALNAGLQQLESDWLEASEALDHASQSD